ncbi:LysR substrate-binding domain-containing protein [Undibacterium sp. TJN19]|uniref:LysR substrate-binding domain-containing protein n=1 Tax=Undibacterium sp. TJN19 TaxID=3413055 RepID=UPI003BF0F874
MLSVESLTGFVAVVDTGSFSAAAERLGQTPSGVSRTISRLEAQLGMTLLTRTTRRLDLTEEGAWLLQRARKILADLHETEEHLLARMPQPSGLVRVNAATPVFDHMIAPLVADFLECYPLIRLELVSGETIVDLIEERADLGIRIAHLADSSLHARSLGSSRMRLVASPQYLARHGEPQTVAELHKHRLLGFTTPVSLNTWPLKLASGVEGLEITPVVSASSGETLRHLVLNGAGIACLGDFMTATDRAQGRLLPVLAASSVPWVQPVWAVFYKQEAMAPRVAAFVNFLATRLALDKS